MELVNVILCYTMLLQIVMSASVTISTSLHALVSYPFHILFLLLILIHRLLTGGNV